MKPAKQRVVSVRFNGSLASAKRLAASVTKASSGLFIQSNTKWAVRVSGLLAVIVASGCCSHREGDIVMSRGDAYVFTKTLTKEQIREGREIEKLWLEYRRTNQPSKL